ncbi:uncharacterized protein LOC120662998 [Panicum virgatum]|uniref:uncharacterized protein LOC120662998 n=1 Tax=Panicum virgatum TaxID=38727 RepID=UPI0019D550F2|nr:uncharacterized protein LOC120662998 [Panicum virgatum]
MLPTSTLKPQKDLRFSFALFKLLRCRFARYKVTNNAGSKSMDALSFFWSLLLKDGEHDRVFLVISDELSFLHDYYYSSLPIYYSRYWLPILGIFISLLCIVCCVLLIPMLVWRVVTGGNLPQVSCSIFCIRKRLLSDTWHLEEFGSWYLDLVPVFLLLVLVMMAEVRDIASYICSNWTKVALICHLVNRASSPHNSSLLKERWIGRLLCCRCRLMKHYWDEKIGQCSILEIGPSTTTLLVPLMRLLRLPDQNRKVKVPAAVKVCIMEVLRSSRNWHLSNGTSCLHRQGHVGERFLWACSNKSTSRPILTWHIATSILEVRYTHLDGEEQGSSTHNYKIVATRLSGYCAYLVTWCPDS